MKPLLSRLAAFDRAEGLLSPRDRVLAAVSGGADSVCLAHWLATRRAKGRIAGLALVHFHHGLRGREADKDAAAVRALAEKLGVGFTLAALDVRGAAAERRAGLEDAGRALRYAALARLARSGGYTKVALGHHLDDNAETVLMHLLRGTKAAGLAGIPPRRALKGCRAEVVRPLLALTRAETRAYCRSFGLSWREDASNKDEGFTRNWVRRRLIPMMEKKSPRLREHLAALAADLRRPRPSR
ncbi:tRNA lysidine(34) synthetase TilS [bacterium]|nr:MAG: tRNA lysidine(34) synthetase TilS [bacterium]